MTSSKLLTRSLTSLALFSLAACSTAPRVDLPAGSDPQVKIRETSERLNSDQGKQFDLLSPGHFSEARKDLTEARSQSEKGDNSEAVLGDVGKAMAQLDIVEANGQRSSQTLATVLSARTFAKAANADQVVPSEFKSADNQLRSFGDDIESNSFNPEADKLTKLESNYSALELLAIKHNTLGEAKSLIDKADKDGAEDKAPKTYNQAKVLYSSAARSIEANRRTPDAYKSAVDQSIKSAKKLNQVLATIDNSKTSETAAVQIYDQQQQLAANQTSLSEANTRTEEANVRTQEANVQTQEANDRTEEATVDASNKEAQEQQHIQTLQGENQQYADKEALNQKIASIKAEFSPSEADVVRDGKKIIVRLKSMKFSTDRFELTTSSLGTLQKVKQMIAAVPVTKVIVEGHTDSIGGEEKNMALSQKRAETIRKYFIAEKTLPEDKVEAKGFGYQRPLTTNKTKEGRATNRRVDVVIETTSTI
jgi:outer membrane protein OmpA-like peptidoglycan-associated protein